VANGNSLEEGTPPMPFASHTFDEKSEQEDPFFFGTNAPAFDAAQRSRSRISAVYPVDRCPSRALTYLSRSEKKSISARSSPGRLSASRKCKATSGWSALWIMIWDTSISRPACSNRWKVRSAQKCYLCSRYIVPMSSAGPLCIWWTRWDSNPQPPHCEPWGK
jgi:hypothetical protein